MEMLLPEQFAGDCVNSHPAAAMPAAGGDTSLLCRTERMSVGLLPDLPVSESVNDVAALHTELEAV